MPKHNQRPSFATHLEGRNGQPGGGDDRLFLHTDADGLVLLLADGATGWGMGGAAADAVMETFGAQPFPGDVEAAKLLLAAADRHVFRQTRGEGDTTAIVARVSGRLVYGASVGDSRLVAFRDGGRVELTGMQVRKPRVGSGCRPVGFSGSVRPGTMLVAASDGFWDFASMLDVCAAVEGSEGRPDTLVPRLVALVRGDRRDLPDDLAIAAVHVD